MTNEKMMETVYPNQQKKRKATEAWASRHRFWRSSEPLVISLEIVYNYKVEKN